MGACGQDNIYSFVVQVTVLWQLRVKNNFYCNREMLSKQGMLRLCWSWWMSAILSDDRFMKGGRYILTRSANASCCVVCGLSCALDWLQQFAYSFSASDCIHGKSKQNICKQLSHLKEKHKLFKNIIEIDLLNRLSIWSSRFSTKWCNIPLLVDVRWNEQCRWPKAA